MPAEKKVKAFKYGTMGGLALIGVGIGGYTWEVMAPLSAEKIVRFERSKATLPMNIGPLVRWDAIEASGRRVTYVYTLGKAPQAFSDRLALISGLRQQVTDYLCGDRLYRAAVKQNISFEFVYKFPDETYPGITLSPGECKG